MPMTQYALWLVEATYPADEHKIHRHTYLESPDDLIDLLKTVIPRLNRDMRVVGEPQRFDVTDRAGFEEAVKAADAKDRQQPGWKAPGKYDMSMTQEQIDRIRTEREAAMAALRPSAPAKPTPEAANA